MQMEDSTFMDLMNIDTDDYLIDDWEYYFSLVSEETTKPGYVPGFELVPERPTKQMKVNKVQYSTLSSSSSSSSSGSLTGQVISFGSDPDMKVNVVETSLDFSNQVNMDQKLRSERKECGNNHIVVKREPNLLKEHVLAERKRRQKLNERLIALSALLPDLKKTDKATVLEDAIKHLRQLQERIKKLEEERVETKRMDQSVILVKRSQVYVQDDSSTCSASVSILKQTMPMIEARVSNRDLLITVHCDKKKGSLIKILTSLEKYRLEVINSSSLPFGNSTLVITILSKMNKNFSRPVEEVVSNLRLALAT